MLIICALVQEVKAFNVMLGRLLNAGYISQARELAALFEHDSPDLTIVLVRFHTLLMFPIYDNLFLIPTNSLLINFQCVLQCITI